MCMVAAVATEDRLLFAFQIVMPAAVWVEDPEPVVPPTDWKGPGRRNDYQALSSTHQVRQQSVCWGWEVEKVVRDWLLHCSYVKMWWWHSSAIWPVRSRSLIVVRKKVYSKRGERCWRLDWRDDLVIKGVYYSGRGPNLGTSLTLRGSQPPVSSFGVSWGLWPQQAPSLKWPYPHIDTHTQHTYT